MDACPYAGMLRAAIFGEPKGGGGVGGASSATDGRTV